jgi:hypothetical protein
MFKKMTTATLFALSAMALADSASLVDTRAPLSSVIELNNYENFDGITCAVMVLNHLEWTAVDSSSLGNISIFTQENIFTDRVKTIISKELVKKRGIYIEELHQIFVAMGLKAKTQYPHIMTESALRELIQSTLHHPAQAMIVQYDASKLIGQKGVGTAVVMDLDPAGYVTLLSPRHEPNGTLIVSAKDLLKSMQSLDENHIPRGMIIIEKPLDDADKP